MLIPYSSEEDSPLHDSAAAAVGQAVQAAHNAAQQRQERGAIKRGPVVAGLS